MIRAPGVRALDVAKCPSNMPQESGLSGPVKLPLAVGPDLAVIFSADNVPSHET
jgi:hypothetical protein